MVIQYPKSFRDEIEGQVVGTGYDSLTKQMLSRIDNYTTDGSKVLSRKGNLKRRDILSSKEMEDLVKEWPFLYQENGIRLHFRELTGVDITLNFDESTETKFKRILRYFQFQQSDPTKRQTLGQSREANKE
ncbi:hypothetical protein NQZ68_017498, partial [Dissostichus eleginoides]